MGNKLIYKIQQCEMLIGAIAKTYYPPMNKRAYGIYNVIHQDLVLSYNITKDGKHQLIKNKNTILFESNNGYQIMDMLDVYDELIRKHNGKFATPLEFYDKWEKKFIPVGRVELERNKLKREYEFLLNGKIYEWKRIHVL